MRAKSVILFFVMAVGLIGCATPPMYHWGNYEHSLYQYYKHPEDESKIAESLATIIKDGEVDGRVPPGIYAEYGYFLLSSGHSGEAITYFKKEKKIWPESSMLMDKMIGSAKHSDKKSSTEDVKQTTEAGGAIQ